MEPLRPKKSVRRIIALHSDEHANVVPVTLYERSPGKKQKGSRLFRPAEKIARRLVEAERAKADSYLARHARSNEKKRDGWLRDLAYNLTKASNQGLKRLKIRRLPL